MPKVVNKEEKRSEIARGALQLFARKGFEKTTIQAIADAIGSGKGTIYQYFSTKEEILERVSREIFKEIEVTLGMALLKLSDPREKLSALIRETLLYSADLENIFMVYMELWLMHIRSREYGQYMKYLEDMLQTYRDLVGDIIEEGKRRGQFREDVDSEALAIFLVGSLDGVGMHHIFDHHGFDMVRIADEFTKRLFSGIDR